MTSKAMTSKAMTLKAMTLKAMTSKVPSTEKMKWREIFRRNRKSKELTFFVALPPKATSNELRGRIRILLSRDWRADSREAVECSPKSVVAEWWPRAPLAPIECSALPQIRRGSERRVTNIAVGVSAIKYSERLTLFHGEIIEIRGRKRKRDQLAHRDRINPKQTMLVDARPLQ